VASISGVAAFQRPSSPGARTSCAIGTGSSGGVRRVAVIGASTGSQYVQAGAPEAGDEDAKCAGGGDGATAGRTGASARSHPRATANASATMARVRFTFRAHDSADLGGWSRDRHAPRPLCGGRTIHQDVGFAGKTRRFDAHRAARRQPPVPPSSLARVIVLAVLVALAAGWAVAHHYTRTPRPLYSPVPTGAPSYDADAGELPVPELTD